MKFTIFTLLLVATTVFSAAVKPRDKNNRPYNVICYYGTWSYYRPGDGQFNAENINPYLCTHVNYAFAKLDKNKMVLFDEKLDVNEEHMIQRVANLRKLNPSLSVLISIGGWNEGSTKYSEMVQKSESRKIFVDSVVEFIKKYDLDGFDFDWEYPGFHANGGGDRQEGRKQDIQDYVTLLKELKEAFAPSGYLLTAAVSAGKWTIDNAYDIKGLNANLDWINLMSYDLHGSWEHKTGHNSPLHAYSHEDWDVGAKQLTIEFAVDLWIKRGMDPKKIVLGVPLYARTFKLGSQTAFKPGDTAIGGGDKGKLTEESGMLGYNEICLMIKQGGWKVYWDDKALVPYAVHANQWASFDNVKSVEEKVKWLIAHKLGGAMVWSIETDDFHGLCGEGQYPLLKTLSKNLNGIDGPDVHIPIPHGFTTAKHSSDQTAGPTTKNPNPVTDSPKTDSPKTDSPKTDPPVTDKPDPSGKFKCTAAGFFKDPKDPRKFHQCVNFGGHLKDYEFECGEGTHYDDKLHVCV